MTRVFWDSMLFIYWLEDNPDFGERVRDLRSSMLRRGDYWMTSALAVGEMLAGARKANSREREDAIMRFFGAELIEVLPFTASAATHFADIRANYRVGAPDAIHLACAAEAKTNVFITNDASLSGKKIRGIDFIVSLETDIL